MSKKRSFRISTLGSQISTIVSVALVLLIIGMILTISSLTGGAADSLRQRVSLVVSLEQDITPAAIESLKTRLNAQPFTSALTYTSADEVLSQEMSYNKDILEVLGTNPYSAEFELFLQPRYVDTDSIVKIINTIGYLEGVSDVYTQADVIENINSWLSKATMVLTVIGLILLSISLVLLFNTINLVIYSRRFVIRTMQLIGATGAFIRRPFIISGIVMGVLAALIASTLLVLMHVYAMSAKVDNIFFAGWVQTGWICGILFVAGIVICGSASAIATNKFLRASYEKLYRK